MKKITNHTVFSNQVFTLDKLITVQYGSADFLSQIESIQERIDLSTLDDDVVRFEKILYSIKKSNNFKISMTLADWIFLDDCYCLKLGYDQRARYPEFVEHNLCPKIELEIDVDEFCNWLKETTKSQLWDIEQELQDKYASERSSYLDEMTFEVEKFVNNLNTYRAFDALDFYKSGGNIKIMVSNQIIRELNYDIDRSEPKERYIFETLTGWLCSLSGEAFQNSGLIFFKSRLN